MQAAAIMANGALDADSPLAFVLLDAINYLWDIKSTETDVVADYDSRPIEKAKHLTDRRPNAPPGVARHDTVLT